MLLFKVHTTIREKGQLLRHFVWNKVFHELVLPEGSLCHLHCPLLLALSSEEPWNHRRTDMKDMRKTPGPLPTTRWDPTNSITQPVIQGDLSSQLSPLNHLVLTFFPHPTKGCICLLHSREQPESRQQFIHTSPCWPSSVYSKNLEDPCL